MKLALITVGSIVLLALVVYVIGALLPKSHRVSRSALYHATQERLFSLISGPQDWRPDVARFESLPDAANRYLVRETSRDGSIVTYELKQITPLASLTRRIATENLPYSGTWTYTLHREGAATSVQITEDGEIYSPIFRFVSRFIMGKHGTIDSYLRALGKATGEDVVTRCEEPGC